MTVLIKFGLYFATKNIPHSSGAVRGENCVGVEKVQKQILYIFTVYIYTIHTNIQTFVINKETNRLLLFSKDAIN